MWTSPNTHFLFYLILSATLTSSSRLPSARHRPPVVSLFERAPGRAKETEDEDGLCRAPRLDEPDFLVRCFMGYSEKRYLCDPDQAISAMEIDRIETDILSKAKFYRYCKKENGGGECPSEERNVANIGYDNDEGRTKMGFTKNISLILTHITSTRIPPMSKYQREYYERFIKKKDTMPPVFLAVNIYSKLVHPRTIRMVKKHLPCALPLLGSSSTDSSINMDEILEEDRIIEAYGILSEDRWRMGRACYPNITILVFLGPKVTYIETGGRQESYNQPRLYVQHALGNHKAVSWLNSKIDKLVKEINSENTSFSGSEKLYKFLQKFTGLYEEANQSRRHVIPFWAAVTFGVCLVLSTCAVLVGNFITSADRRGNRKVKNCSKGSPSRKWRAGFSGGMWASV